MPAIPSGGDLQSPGIGVLEAAVVDHSHPITLNLPSRVPITHYNGPLFMPIAGVVPGAERPCALVRMCGPTACFTASEAFLEQRPVDETTMIVSAAQAACASVIGGALEAGQVVLMGSHPELGCDLSLEGVEDAALLVANALFRHSATVPAGRVANAPALAWPALWAESPAACLDMGRHMLPAIAGLLGELAAIPGQQRPWWLDRRYSMSLFGLEPATIWERELRRMHTLLGRLVATMDRTHPRLEHVVLWSRNEPSAHELIDQVVREYLYRPDPAKQQDGGFRGVASLLREAHELLAEARRRSHAPAPTPPVDPYDGAEQNPYHLVVGSYLAAAGLLTGAQLLADSIASLLE